jgi:hypothetical protein
MAIILMVIGGYFIGGSWWLLETETKINLAASIHEWRRILFRSKNPDGRVCMGCMENGDLSV